MSAPGNLILIIALLAAFVACCGYAAGRIHQRRQTGSDREAAYRDGYETGTHSVFGMAVRMIAPRRAAIRASAAVKRSGAGPTPSPQSRSPQSPSPQSRSPQFPSPVPARPSTPASPSPSTSKPAPNAAPSAPAPSRPVVPPPGPAAPVPASPAVAPGPLGFLPPSPRFPLAPPSSSEFLPPSSAAASRRPAPEPAEFGFPAPPPPPSGTIPEPAAIGGVQYQTFPDPRTGGETTVLPDMRDVSRAVECAKAHRVPRPSHPATSPSSLSFAPSSHAGGRLGFEVPPAAVRPSSPAETPTSPEPGVPAEAGGPDAAPPAGRSERGGGRRNLRRSAGHRAPDDDPHGAESLSADDPVSSAGRHTVPDELVQAATYRLPPDRVFRAKVRDSDTLPDESTTRLVPKPRQS